MTLNSVHTNTFPILLKELGLSLVVSTYQAGKLVILRADGNVINTHFRDFPKPMGITADQSKITVGTGYQIVDLRNIPAVAGKLEPAGKHDACYLPRHQHITGDIDIHEMEWLGQDLWFINTRFSCLCNLDPEYSFVPRWRPPFVTAYDLTDRCHLNGFCALDNQPKFATALGETDTPAGWRKNKASGGILMDIPSNEIIVRGLSMPHSPRIYRGKVWVLESGRGSLSQVDLATGKLTTVAELPGFTRGIDFYGDFAFIGLSQVRESAVFSGIPIAQLTERHCGIWVVNINSGEIVAFLKFTLGVQEIFAVSVLPGIRFPEIISDDQGLLATSYVVPDEALAEVIMPSQVDKDAEYFLQTGNKFYHEGKLSEAIAQYRQCIPLKPDWIMPLYNLGVALGDLEEYAEAIAVLNRVVEAEPDHAEAFNSLGYVYSQVQDFARAIPVYDKAIELNGQFAKAHFNLGMILLKLGEFPRGWHECEWRWQTQEFHPFECPQPRWQNQDITGKNLLVHTEQGAGDAMQFIRYIPLIKDRCAKIILVCMPELVPLFAEVEGVSQVRSPGNIDSSEFDVYVPLMSLPYICQTTLDNIPVTIPYLENPGKFTLPTDQTKQSKLKVGIVWAGSATHKNDKYRSAQLTDILPFLANSQIEFYSLQKGERVKDLELLPNLPIHNLSEHINNYGDTANIIQELDLVIGVDTSVIHLAGALGKPVWVLLSVNCDWRWLLERKDSPWYPTMRLYRQNNLGDWSDVVKNIAKDLNNLVDTKNK